MPAHRPHLDSHTRKFFLPAITIQRLGGQQAAETMRLMLEGNGEAEILDLLQIDAAKYLEITSQHLFRRELKAQADVLKRNQKAMAAKTAVTKQKPDKVPAAVTQVALAKGQSPTDYVIKRIGQVSPEAVEKLIWLMHHSRQENIQYNSATKLLGLNGIVEVEKSISVIADAEAIIRELNRRGPYNKTKEIELEAELIQGGERLTPGDSEASTPSIPSTTPEIMPHTGIVDRKEQDCGDSWSAPCGEK